MSIKELFERGKKYLYFEIFVLRDKCVSNLPGLAGNFSKAWVNAYLERRILGRAVEYSGHLVQQTIALWAWLPAKGSFLAGVLWSHRYLIGIRCFCHAELVSMLAGLSRLQPDVSKLESCHTAGWMQVIKINSVGKMHPIKEHKVS